MLGKGEKREFFKIKNCLIKQSRVNSRIFGEAFRIMRRGSSGVTRVRVLPQYKGLPTDVSFGSDSSEPSSPLSPSLARHAAKALVNNPSQISPSPVPRLSLSILSQKENRTHSASTVQPEGNVVTSQPARTLVSPRSSPDTSVIELGNSKVRKIDSTDQLGSGEPGTQKSGSGDTTDGSASRRIMMSRATEITWSPPTPIKPHAAVTQQHSISMTPPLFPPPPLPTAVCANNASIISTSI